MLLKITIKIKITNHYLLLLKVGLKNLFQKKRAENLKWRIKDIVSEKLSKKLWDTKNNSLFETDISDILSGRLSPYELAEKIISKLE